MCQYRYYYFGACQHQETVLFGFCANATTPTTAHHPEKRLPNCAHASEPPTAPSSRFEPGSGDVVQDAAPPATSTSAHAITSNHPSHKSVSSSSALQAIQSAAASSSSPVSISSSSILLQKPPPGSITSFAHRSQRPPSNPAMAGLAPFTNSNLHQLMTGKSMLVAANAKAPPLQKSRGDMYHHEPKSGTQLAFATEQDGAYVDHAFFNTPATAKVTHREHSESVVESFESLAAEIDEMKSEVEKLKEEAVRELEHHQRDNVDMTDLPALPPSPVKSKIPAPVSRSAAAILQLEHERSQSKRDTIAPKPHSRVPPPSPREFPELGNATYERCSKGETGMRKLSYASMATTGMLEAINQRYATPSNHHDTSAYDGHNGIATASETSTTQVSTESDVFTSATESTANTSHIISPRTVLATRAGKTSTIGKTTPGSSSGQSLKHSPHFAQPTMASNVRTGETLRKDSFVGSVADGSPTKSMRTITQRNAKRPSLPGGWMGSPDRSPSTAAAEDGAVFGRGQLQHEKTQSALPSHPQATPVQPLQKKPSTYMSPTKATVQRNMMTIRQESPKRASSRKALPRLTTALSPSKNPASPGSALFSARSTGSSASENIITDFNARRRFAGRGIQFAGKTGFTPVHVRNPGAAYSRSSSDIRRRMTTGATVADALAGHAEAAQRPLVANTKKVRRESTGDLLNPIKARLNNLGLLSDKPQAYVADDECSVSNARPTILQPASVLSPRASSNAARDQSQASEQRRASVVPPHRRHRTDHSTEIGDSSRCSSVVVITANKALPAQTTAPSLRATAQVFTPRSTSSVTATAGKFTGSRGSLGSSEYTIGSTWDKFSPEKGGNGLPAQAFRALEYTGSPIGHPQPWTKPTFSPHDLAAAPPADASINSSPMSTTVRAGQVLRPNFIPEINSLQWTMQDNDGHQSLVNFGRAAAPPMPQTPIFSPASDDTSPRRTPGMSPWAIGASLPTRARYGWTGGDGREIRFVRYGPDAERESNAQFNYSNYKGRTPERGPRMVGHESEDGHFDAPLAPRSRQQWAALMGYPKVPCGDVQITQAVEQLPMLGSSVKGIGYCGSCAD